MCGFVGVWTLRPPFDGPEFPPGLLDRLAHRGPDGKAWKADDRYRLGFRRLAIIDLATGMQPLLNEDGRVAAVVNGEIYNHRSLRSTLAATHDFRTGSDAEVVLHGYEEWGPGVFQKLRGMFAVALTDRAGEKLILARDRVGKKPLYYRVDGNRLRFASEISPLLDKGENVDRQALNDYLRFGYVPAPRTIFAGISKLPAGCVLIADADGRVRVDRWVPRLIEAASPPSDSRAWAAELREALDDAVRVRLESEVPMGFLLSGGVDSASVFALGAQALGEGARAFTVGFDEREVDESAAAASVARRYRAQHRLLRLGREQAPGLVEVVARCEEPVATDALLPTDHLFAALRAAGITTVLAGEGADEIFAGYAKFRAAAAASLGQPSNWVESGRTPTQRYLASEEFCFPTVEERRELIGDVASDEGFEELEGQVAHLDPLSQALALEVALRLPDRINHRLDRLSMAHSVEARAPFMDANVMALAVRIPHEVRVRGGIPKAVLRRAMAADLPLEVATARKTPFRAPDTWFVGDGAGLDPREAAYAGLVEPRVVRRLQAKVQVGDRAAAERLYNLTVLHLWHRRVFCEAGRPFRD